MNARREAAERAAEKHPNALVRQWHNGRRGWFVVDERYATLYEDFDLPDVGALAASPYPFWLYELAKAVRDQDDAATSFPVFCVFQKERVYGVTADYTETFIWVHPDDPERESDKPVKGWRKVGYTVVNRFCTAAFTRVGAEHYIQCNGHNLKEPFIYVESAHRNEQWKEIRGFLLNVVLKTALA